MKILFATPYFFPRVGGMENYALATARELRRSGHDVMVVSSLHEASLPAKEVVEGIRVVRLPMSFKASNTPYGLRWRRELRRILRVEAPDVVNAHTPVPGMADVAVRAAHTLGIPTVLTYQNDVVKSGRIAGMAARAFCLLVGNRTLALADVIIVSSPYYLDISRYLGRWRDKVEAVVPGVDLKRFNREVSPDWLRARFPGKQIVLFVGNLGRAHAHKGVDVLFDAMARLPAGLDAVLVLVGEGDALEDLERRAAERGLTERVHFAGFASHDDLPRYYAGSHVLVLPSINAQEGFGLVLLEAGACGTPVIATRVGGVPFAVEHETTGLLVEPGDADALARAMERAMSSEGKAFGEAGERRARESFSWQAAAATTLDAYERARTRAGGSRDS